MIALTSRAMALATGLVLTNGSMLVAQSNACALLTSAEAVKHIARGEATYGETPEAVTVSGGKGMLCEYGFGGQIGVWIAPNAEENFNHFLKNFRMDKETRHPVSGVGDRAWIMYPAPADEYKLRPAYLVTHVGQKIVTVALFARKGSADSPMGQVCRGDQSRLKPDEKEDCKKVLANKSETQESLKPNVIELAKLVVEKVKAGK
jgi:hypothetical protein